MGCNFIFIVLTRGSYTEKNSLIMKLKCDFADVIHSAQSNLNLTDNRYLEINSIHYHLLLYIKAKTCVKD